MTDSHASTKTSNSGEEPPIFVFDVDKFVFEWLPDADMPFLSIELGRNAYVDALLALQDLWSHLEDLFRKGREHKAIIGNLSFFAYKIQFLTEDMEEATYLDELLASSTANLHSFLHSVDPVHAPRCKFLIGPDGSRMELAMRVDVDNIIFRLVGDSSDDSICVSGEATTLNPNSEPKVATEEVFYFDHEYPDGTSTYVLDVANDANGKAGCGDSACGTSPCGTSDANGNSDSSDDYASSEGISGHSLKLPFDFVPNPQLPFKWVLIYLFVPRESEFCTKEDVTDTA